MVRIVVLKEDLHPDLQVGFEQAFQSQSKSNTVAYYNKLYIVVDMVTSDRGQGYLLEPIGFVEGQTSHDVFATLY